LRVIISFVTVNSHHVSRSLCTCTCVAWHMAFNDNAIDITCVSTATACFCPSNRPVACRLHCSSTATHVRYCSGRLTTYSTYSSTLTSCMQLYMNCAVEVSIVVTDEESARRRRRNRTALLAEYLFFSIFQCVAIRELI